MPKSPFDIPNPSDIILGTKKRSKKRHKIPQAVREQVWDLYIGRGKMEGKCYCDGWRTINYREFEVGHNKAVAKDGKDHISNLRPICGKCNRSMGTMSIEQYKKKYYGKPDTAKKTKSKSKRKSRKKKTTSPFDVSLPKTKFPLF